MRYSEAAPSEAQTLRHEHLQAHGSMLRFTDEGRSPGRLRGLSRQAVEGTTEDNLAPEPPGHRSYGRQDHALISPLPKFVLAAQLP